MQGAPSSEPKAPNNGHAAAARAEPAIMLSRMLAERDKIELEIQRIRDGILTSDILPQQPTLETAASAAAPPDDAVSKAEKSDLELDKLRSDARNARWSQLFEIAKVFVPAIAIAGTIYTTGQTLAVQRERDLKVALKDQSMAILQHLIHFQNQITARTPDNRADLSKQRNAITAIVTLREGALSPLLANLELNHDPETVSTLQTAIVELSEDPALRPIVLNELLKQVKRTALRLNEPGLKRYASVWQDCLNQAADDKASLQDWASRGNRLAEDLKQQVAPRISVPRDLEAMKKTIDGLQRKI
jgi:hypothetical protein